MLWSRMPLFNISEHAQERNGRVIAGLYMAIFGLFVAAVVLGIIGSIAAVAYHFLF